MPYVRTGLDDFVPIEMDTELLQNATIEEEYTIKITNNSELDYSIYPIWGTDNTQKVALRRNYYYYGTQEGLITDEAVTTRIDVLGDYIGSELTADEKNKQYRNSTDMSEILSRTEFIYSKDHSKAQHEYQIVAVYKKCDKSRNARTDRRRFIRLFKHRQQIFSQSKAGKGEYGKHRIARITFIHYIHSAECGCCREFEYKIYK